MEKGLERLQLLQNQISDWSDSTFDNGVRNMARSLPISHHLKKESEELIKALDQYFNFKVGNAWSFKDYESVGEELADCFILILDCAKHFGYNADDLVTAAHNKLEINKSRVWGKPDVNGVVEHIK